MNRIIRRLVATTAAIAAAGGAALTTVVPAQADAASCLAQLSGHAAATPGRLVYPAQPASIRLTTSAYTDKACYQYSVAIGLSRTDLSGFRAAAANDNRWSGSGNYFFHTFTIPPNEPGTWMLRQIAVKDTAGNTSIAQFTAATSPTKIGVYRESFLTGRVVGTAPLTNISAKLQAWSSVGTLANLQNQKVLLQVSKPGANLYDTVDQGTTNRFGQWQGPVLLTIWAGYDHRLAYYSPYQTIASDFHYLGRIPG